jgi:hypothetical protein
VVISSSVKALCLRTDSARRLAALFLDACPTSFLFEDLLRTTAEHFATRKQERPGRGQRQYSQFRRYGISLLLRGDAGAVDNPLLIVN